MTVRDMQSWRIYIQRWTTQSKKLVYVQQKLVDKTKTAPVGYTEPSCWVLAGLAVEKDFKKERRKKLKLSDWRFLAFLQSFTEHSSVRRFLCASCAFFFFLLFSIDKHFVLLSHLWDISLSIGLLITILTKCVQMLCVNKKNIVALLACRQHVYMVHVFNFFARSI